MSENTFLDRLKSGEILISDGATGSNLLQRGLPRGVSSEAWVLDNPQEIIRLHQDFIQAGADIILTCTFGANSIRLQENDLADKTIEINHTAVELARKASLDQSILVGGSIGPIGKLMEPYGPISKDSAAAVFAEQAQGLSDAGVDFLVIETQFDLSEAVAAVIGARKATDLPIVISFSYDSGKHTMMGINPVKMAETFNEMAVDVLGINCGRSLQDNLNALVSLKSATELPIWYKPNAGIPTVDDFGNSHYKLSPEEMGSQTEEWIHAGANIVGGCCGTSPEHLAKISDAVHEIRSQV